MPHALQRFQERPSVSAELVEAAIREEDGSPVGFELLNAAAVPESGIHQGVEFTPAYRRTSAQGVG